MKQSKISNLIKTILLALLIGQEVTCHMITTYPKFPLKEYPLKKNGNDLYWIFHTNNDYGNPLLITYYKNSNLQCFYATLTKSNINLNTDPRSAESCVIANLEYLKHLNPKNTLFYSKVTFIYEGVLYLSQGHAYIYLKKPLGDFSQIDLTLFPDGFLLSDPGTNILFTSTIDVSWIFYTTHLAKVV